MRCSRQMFHVGMGAHRRKECFDNLSTVISEYVPRDAVWDFSMRKQNCSLHGCCPRRWISSSQLGVLVGNYKYVLVT